MTRPRAYEVQLICPYCARASAIAAVADGFTEREPRPGDANLCFYCAEPSTFDVGPLGLMLRPSTPEESVQTEIENGGLIAELRAFHVQEMMAGRPVKATEGSLRQVLAAFAAYRQGRAQ